MCPFPHTPSNFYLTQQKDIDSNGNIVQEDRPSGACNEYRQPAKNINAKHQQYLRKEKRREKLAAVHKEAVVTENVVKDVLHRNQLVEKELCDKTVTGVLEDVSVSAFLDLKPAQKLEDFIHACRFNGKTFHKSKLAGADGKLNKTWCKHQMAESIENDCLEEKLCLVWLAWKLRSAPIVLKEITVPALDASLPTPSFTINYAGPERAILPSEYLMRTSWVGRIKLAVKGVNLLDVDENLMKKAIVPS